MNAAWIIVLFALKWFGYKYSICKHLARRTDRFKNHQIGKLGACATEELEMNFWLLLLDLEDTQLETFNNIAMKIKELEKVLKVYDMINISSVFILNKARGNDSQILHKINLLENYNTNTLEQVKILAWFYGCFGQTYDLQNL